MDPTLVAQFSAGWANALQGMHIRAEDDHRVVQGVMTRMLIQTGDPSNYADFQSASHVPTPQPYVVPNFVQPTGKPVGS